MTESQPDDDRPAEPTVTRKDFLKAAGVGLAGLALPSQASLSQSTRSASGTKLLFFDDYRIEDSDGVERVFHEAEKPDENPVVRPTEPWEKLFGSDDHPGNVFGGTVLYDEDEGIFKMWYQTFWVEGDFADYGYYVCYATSEDGITWEKPDLGIFEYEGSTQNNILRIEPFHTTSVIDHGPADSEYVASASNDILWQSPDGVNWEPTGTRLPNVPTGGGEMGADSTTVSYDPSGERYISVIQGSVEIRGHLRRTLFATRSDDFENWSDPELVVVADEEDDEIAEDMGFNFAGMYNMSVDNYDGIYIGLLKVIYDGGGGPVTQVAFSRDSETWIREHRAPIIPLGEDGEFDSTQIFGFAQDEPGFLVVDDEIWVYYGGWDGPHDSTNRGARIGLAKWRLDGFASLANDGDSPGTITTEPVTVDGDRLLVNADLENEGGKNGSLKVEVLDTDGAVVDGFERENCVAMHGDEIRHAVNWREPTRIGSLAGEEVKLRVYIEDGHVYSVQFAEESEST